MLFKSRLLRSNTLMVCWGSSDTRRYNMGAGREFGRAKHIFLAIFVSRKKAFVLSSTSNCWDHLASVLPNPKFSKLLDCCRHKPETKSSKLLDCCRHRFELKSSKILKYYGYGSNSKLNKLLKGCRHRLEHMFNKLLKCGRNRSKPKAGRLFKCYRRHCLQWLLRILSIHILLQLLLFFQNVNCLHDRLDCWSCNSIPSVTILGSSPTLPPQAQVVTQQASQMLSCHSLQPSETLVPLLSINNWAQTARPKKSIG